MRAIRIHEFGGPDVLRTEDIPVPRAGEGEVRVAVAAVGVNYLDIQQRTGAYPIPLPATIGVEGGGFVDVIGPRAVKWRPGKRVVWGQVPGSYAERALVPWDRLVPVPDELELEVATAGLLQGLTAHSLSHSTHPVQPGDSCLVHAAAGGVGRLLTQMIRMRGGRVIGTVSTPQKAAVAREAGADEVVIYTEDDFEEGVKHFTGGQGVNVAYDAVGLTTWEKSLRSLAPRGHLVLFGQASGAVPPIDPQQFLASGSFTVTRASLKHYIASRTDLLTRSAEVLGWASSGKLRLSVHLRLPLERAADAHRALEGRETVGKVLLIP